MKHKFLSLTLAIFVMAGASINTVSAETRVVNSAGDSGTGTLRQAITEAQDGDEITFDELLEGQTITLESVIKFENKALTISGSGQKLVAATKGYGAFEFNGGNNVTFERLWFDGFSAGNGGAIFTNGNGTHLTVKSCIFTNNGDYEGGSTGHGGAIATMWGGDDATILGCTFVGNGAENGGAIFIHNHDATGIGNVFYGNTTRGSGRFDFETSDEHHILPADGTYNVTDKVTGGLTNSDATTVVIDANPFDENYVPTTDAIAILPEELPEGYPTEDFYGNPIEGGGYAGAVQGAVPEPITWDISAVAQTDSVIATLSRDGTVLTIGGRGCMKNFLTSYEEPYVGGGAPWVVDLEFDADGKVKNYTRLPYRLEINTIIVEEGVTNLGNSLAWGITDLHSISLPSTLDSIGHRAFSAHKLWDTIRVPDNVKKIGTYGFEGSAGNTVGVIILPASLESVRYEAFSGMFYVGEIYTYAETPPAIENSTTFGGISKNDCIIYVPVGKAEDYKAANEWKAFKNIQEFIGIIPGVELPYESGVRTFADDTIPSLTGSFADKGNPGVVAVKFTVDQSGWFAIDCQDYTLYLFNSAKLDEASLVVKSINGIGDKTIYPAGTYYLVIDDERLTDNAVADYNLTVTFHGTGIDNADRTGTVKSVTYYDLLGRQVRSNATGIVIKRITYDDGSVETKKEYVKD